MLFTMKYVLASCIYRLYTKYKTHNDIIILKECGEQNIVKWYNSGGIFLINYFH